MSNKTQSVQNQLGISNSCVESVFLHECLEWAEGQTTQIMVDSCRRKIARRMKMILYPKAMTNSKVNLVLGPLSEEVGERRGEMLGHVCSQGHEPNDR